MMATPAQAKPAVLPPVTTATATLQQPTAKPAVNPGVPGAQVAGESGTMGTLGQASQPNLHPVGTGTQPLVNPGPAGPAVNPGPGGTVSPPPSTGGPAVNPGVPGALQPATAQPQVPYASLSSYGPGNDLIGTQIAPTAGPDRAALAQQSYDLLQQQAEPAYQQQLRQVGQDAAKFGRIGSGLTTSALGDVQSQHQRDLSQAQQNLSINAAGQTLADQSALRSELRGERTYEGGQQTQAQQDAINQQILQDQLLNSSNSRSNSQIQNLIQLGQNGNPASTLLNASGQAGNQAGQTSSSAADLLQQWALQQALGVH